MDLALWANTVCHSKRRCEQNPTCVRPSAVDLNRLYHLGETVLCGRSRVTKGLVRDRVLWTPFPMSSTFLFYLVSGRQYQAIRVLLMEPLGANVKAQVSSRSVNNSVENTGSFERLGKDAIEDERSVGRQVRQWREVTLRLPVKREVL